MLNSVFKGLIDRNISIKVELKNGVELSGTLTYFDHTLNLYLDNPVVSDPEKYPQFLSLKTCFIRGSTVRYIHLPPNELDLEIIQEACKKELKEQKGEK